MARDACVALGGAWAAPRRLNALVFGPGPHEPDEDGMRKLAAAFVLASTAPPLPATALNYSSSDAVEYVRRLVSTPGNRRVLSSLGFWSNESESRPRARRLSTWPTAIHLEGIAHDLTFAGHNLDLMDGDVTHARYGDIFDPHVTDTELSYLLGGVAANWNDWDIMFDENPGVTCINAAYCSEALGGEPPEGPPEEGEAHFFAGCDENHEPIGMGLALYAFERDDARPGRAKTVAVFASELG